MISKSETFKAKLNFSVPLAFCFLAGALIDFTVDGIFKIIWFVVYAPVYVALVMTLTNYTLRTRWARQTTALGFSFVAGATLAHLIFVGHVREVRYTLSGVSLSPITLSSNDWAQDLIVTSQKLSEKLSEKIGAAKVAGQPIEISLREVTDYGCIRSFEVDKVDGIDIRTDPTASWLWKSRGEAPSMALRRGAPPDDLDVTPGHEDVRLPWCLIQFYRKK